MGSSDRRKSFDSLLKMDISRWLSLILAVLTYTTPVSSSEPRVVCYYTNWSVYRPGTARFNPQNINPYLCTHLIYAFGGFTKDNTLKPFDKYQDIEKGGYAKFTGLKTYNKNLKTLLAIGGWNEGSTRFSPMVAARDRRKEFVRNAIKFLRQNRFDGLDLDWEYPAFRDGGKPKDRENYAKLVKELREEFEKEAEKTNKPRLLLTMAVPAGIEYIQKGFDVRTLNKYLDWMNLLTYDYHSAFEPAVNHHAPLFPLEEPNEYSVDNELNIDYTIKFYLDNGADRDKLVLGIPTYGRSYTLFNADAVEIGSPADGPGDQGDATREKGYLAYYEICEAIKAKTKKRNAASDEDSEEDSEEEVDEPWTVMYPNPSAMGPVAYKGNQWVGYDDIEIVRRKAEYVAENGLGGIMFWSIDNDDFRGNCHEKPYPLIEAAKESYIAKLGSTHNVIVTEKPASSNRNRKKRPRTTSTTTTAKPSLAAKAQSNKRTSLTSTTPSWNVITPEPPTTPDPGSDFKCTDEGFFPHPRDCKKYFWCLDSGPSNLGIVAHQFTCPSGLFFNKAADSCDFARNVLCKKPAATTKAPTTKTTVTSTTTTTTTTRKPIKLSTKSSSLFRTTSTTTTTPEPESEEEYDNEFDSADVDAEDPRVIKELIDLIKKVGGVEQLEKHLKLSDSSGSQLSTDGAVTTTVSPIISKILYQKVLERTRGRNKYGNNNEGADNSVLNSRRGPQNAGLESTQDKDKLFRKDRPQYTTINRLRSSTSTTEEPEQSEESEEEPTIEQQSLYKSRAIETQAKVGTTAKPLQYVNIRRAKPTTTSDTADDTASRNALFERSEAYVTVSEGPTIDIANARRENIPEYVTIRRQRPTTEETTTVQYQTFEPKESQEETSEKEITQSVQPQYKSIVRARSTTVPPLDEPSSPPPTTVLAVQISSLLNSPSSVEAESPEPETSAPAEVVEPTTTTSTTLSTTTTTAVPSSLPTRRTVLRRRGSTTSTTTTPSTTTQVSSRNYTSIRRRRPLSRPNEISTDSDETSELLRKIRSTTPDSREVNVIKNDPPVTIRRRFRSRYQSTQNEDSVPAAASPISRGKFKPTLNRDELVSLTPIDGDESPRFVQKSSFSPRSDRGFRSRTSTTIADFTADSEASAATVEVRRPNILPRGRGRFSPSSTTEPQVVEQSTSAQTTSNQRRPTFARFAPRPFTRVTSTSTTTENKIEDIQDEEYVTEKIPLRLPFGRVRPSSITPVLQPRKLPFPSRQQTTPTISINDDIEEEEEDKNEDIFLSETAIEEKEHDEKQEDVENEEIDEVPKRRIIIKKLRTPTSTTTEATIFTEAIPVEDGGKRKFRVIRRRPSSSTPTVESASLPLETTTSASTRIRKIIRKKIKPVEDEPEILSKSIGSLNSVPKEDTTEAVFNYGEKTKPSVILSSTVGPATSTESKVKSVEEPVTETQNQEIISSNEKTHEKDVSKEDVTESVITGDNNESVINDNNSSEDLTNSQTNSDSPPEVVLQSGEKSIDLSENLPTPEFEEPETTTTSTTELTSPSSRTRLPYRPPKRLFTSTTESSASPSSRTFSRKYNPGAYTSPATAPKGPETFKATVTRKPLFSSRTFTRRPFTTARTTQKIEEEYTDDEEILDEEEPEDSLVLVPPSQLFTRRPKPNEEEEEDYAELKEPEIEENSEEEQQNRFTPSSRKPIFKPRVINSNTFRASTSTTELPKRFSAVLNKTALFSRFGNNKSLNETKKRVQNVPIGYDNKINDLLNKGKLENDEEITTTSISTDAIETTTTDDDDDEDYLTMTEKSSTLSEYTNTAGETASTINLENEITTTQMEFNDSTDDYLEYTEGTTNNPSTQDSTSNTETETINDTPTIYSTTVKPKADIVYVTTTASVETTTTIPTVSPVVRTQFDKLFSVSRVVEVSSKLDKHRVNKNNETTLIEEGKVMVEKKPVVDKIGEVSRYSLIKIVEEDIPLYLTKLSHVYPVENPPDNPIHIDEGRNARALVNFADIPRENLVASESINEAYRHINNVSNIHKEVEHVPSDDFLSYINEDKKIDKSSEDDVYRAEWQFIPAAYENEKNKQNKAAKSFEIVTPRNMLTDPSTLPLEGLFKTENPMAKKIDSNDNQPFVVYSASLPALKEEDKNVKVQVQKPEAGRSIVTFAKGQQFNGAPTDVTTVQYAVNLAILPKTSETTTTASTTTSTTQNINTSPIIKLLTTPQSTTLTTELTTMTSTDSITTTETVPEETTTAKLSLFDTKRSKFAFPRRPVIKPANITRTSPIRSAKKINATVVSNVNQKVNKTTGFNPSKSRFSAVRAQNVPVDARKKLTTSKPATRTFTTESPRSSTERRLFIKPIRPLSRPAFVPRKSTPAPKVAGDT